MLIAVMIIDNNCGCGGSITYLLSSVKDVIFCVLRCVFVLMRSEEYYCVLFFLSTIQ